MPIKPPDYQLKLKLDLPEEEQVSGVSGDALSAEDIRLRSEAARQALEGGVLWPKGAFGKVSAPAWYEQYTTLLAGGWSWKVAVYIAWKAQPKAHRWPENQDELATKILGLTSDRQISVWRMKNPAINAMVHDLAAGMVFDALGDAFAAMVAVASDEDYKGKGDRELMFKLAGILSDKSEISLKAGGEGKELLKNLSFGELLTLAGVDNQEAIMALRDKLTDIPAADEAKSQAGEADDVNAE